MKQLGLVLLFIGMAISAAAGIQLGAGEYSATRKAGGAILTESTEVESLGATPDPGQRLGDWFAEAGVQFALGLVLIVAGAVLGRIADARVEGDGDERASYDFASALALLTSELGETKRVLSLTNRDECQNRIERLMSDRVLPMIDARSSLQHRFGMAGCAAVLGPLSGGERLLNRAWSTLVDGHVDETSASLSGAIEEFRAALETFQSLDQAGTS